VIAYHSLHLQHFGDLLFRQEIDLQIQVIAMLGAAGSCGSVTSGQMWTADATGVFLNWKFKPLADARG
jgi:hypothetical protein